MCVVRLFAAPDAWVIWDEVVTAHALGLTRTVSVPRPVLRPDLSFAHPETQRRLTWISEVDGDRLWRNLTQKLD